MAMQEYGGNPWSIGSLQMYDKPSVIPNYDQQKVPPRSPVRISKMTSDPKMAAMCRAAHERQDYGDPNSISRATKFHHRDIPKAIKHADQRRDMQVLQKFFMQELSQTGGHTPRSINAVGAMGAISTAPKQQRSRSPDSRHVSVYSARSNTRTSSRSSSPVPAIAAPPTRPRSPARSNSPVRLLAPPPSYDVATGNAPAMLMAPIGYTHTAVTNGQPFGQLI
eukprot:TRINITY_DN17164_c0_g1_i1.p1 TRINITY_DN17164_c0_g1~~TRINITY_DN17164_c0_g1_i1.p1  ORF type:complete len:222 (-),score=10.35 TRINITY_DN17164_c0_g1_i1:46-711(-)